MIVLLDTCALLWLLADSEQLSPAARQAIESAEIDGLLVSSGTLHEIAIKASKGLLTLPTWTELQQALDQLGARILPVTPRTLFYYAQCAKAEHKDPFDRLIAAQALEHGACVITCDSQFVQFEVPLIW